MKKTIRNLGQGRKCLKFNNGGILLQIKISNLLEMLSAVGATLMTMTLLCIKVKEPFLNKKSPISFRTSFLPNAAQLNEIGLQNIKQLQVLTHATRVVFNVAQPTLSCLSSRSSFQHVLRFSSASREMHSFVCASCIFYDLGSSSGILSARRDLKPCSERDEKCPQYRLRLD